jgi:hypothetical protein
VLCGKIPDTDNLKEESFILVHSFSNISPWSVALLAFGSMVRQNIMAEGHHRANLLTSWQSESRDWEREEGLGDKIHCSETQSQ